MAVMGKKVSGGSRVQGRTLVYLSVLVNECGSAYNSAFDTFIQSDMRSVTYDTFDHYVFFSESNT